MTQLSPMGEAISSLVGARLVIEQAECVILERNGQTIFPITDAATGDIVNFGFYIGKKDARRDVESDWLFVPISMPQGATADEAIGIMSRALINAIDAVRKR